MTADSDVASAPVILFMCVHNAGRSQIAARFAEALASGRLTVRSAGSEPEDRINPVVVQAMAEVGLDLGDRTPVRITDHAARAADVVVSMGCGDACPLYPGTRYVDWQVPDPAGQDLLTVRGIRDDIRARVGDLLRDLGIDPAPL